MKLGTNPELDAIDFQIVSMLQEHCKTPLAKLGEQVGLSAPSVVERVKKLEDSGIITRYLTVVAARLRSWQAAYTVVCRWAFDQTDGRELLTGTQSTLTGLD